MIEGSMPEVPLGNPDVLDIESDEVIILVYTDGKVHGYKIADVYGCVGGIENSNLEVSFVWLLCCFKLWQN